jgi:3D (Asp-Asp-Asp) domain-containing protein
VAEVLSAANVTLHERDQVTPAAGAAVREGDVIRVVRVEEREVTVEEKIPVPTVIRPPVTGRGPYHPTVTAGGKPGLVRRTYRIVTRDGVDAEKTLVRQEAIRAPVPAVVTARSGITLGTRGVYTGRRVFVMVATAYDPGPGSCGKYADGITCNGKRAGYGIAAVDPTIIPLGSKLYIEGYGYAIAADVGGAIKGYRIDLGYNSRGGAFQWGRRTVRVFVLD